MNKRIYLSSPHMGGREMLYVKNAFDTNWIAPLGPNVDGFEEDISNFLGGKICVAALNSGTAAIHLALVLLGVKAGDEVICQSLTFSASANPILYLGATPVFVDSEATTWNMSPTFLEIAILERIRVGIKPKAIIVVHLYGMPAEMDDLLLISAKYDIPIIEDAAEALGSQYNGKKLGTLGEIGIFSFNGNKIITTSGGGAIISNNKEMVDKARFLACQAKDRLPYFQHSEIGYNYRMSNIAAGIGRGQMEILALRVYQRRRIFLQYKKLLSDIDGLTFQEEPNNLFFSNRWLTALTVDKSKKTDIEALRKFIEEDNVEVRHVWKPMHLQPVFKKYPYYGDGVSDEIFANGICLPSGSNMSDIDLKRVIIDLKKYFVTAPVYSFSYAENIHFNNNYINKI